MVLPAVLQLDPLQKEKEIYLTLFDAILNVPVTERIVRCKISKNTKFI